MTARQLIRLCLLCLAAGAAQGETAAQVVAERMAQPARAHPRLLFTRADEAAVRGKIQSDPLLSRTFATLVAQADASLSAAPVERLIVGNGMLEQVRVCLQRVLRLSFVWRVTGDARYLERARREMLAAAAFSDWYPEHFLDTAEMTAALAIGYDWLYSGLDAETRQTVRRAIVEKGLKTFKGDRGDSNWNQVSNGGMLLGALAVAEHEPALAERTVARAIEDVPAALAQYAPDGAYPEGPVYWGYGTTYTVLMIAACESALGTDFGLTTLPGFMRSAEYYQQMIGPTGQFFNYSDCAPQVELAPLMFWFAKRNREPSLLWFELQNLNRWLAARGSKPGDLDRFLPLLLVWCDRTDAVKAPSARHWAGKGENPVAVYRSGWDRASAFVGVKGGMAALSHGHMDAGSFVFDALGVRWAEDLGVQSYFSLESRGLRIWDRWQGSDRWRVFRINNMSHNTLTVDGKPFTVKGKATIEHSDARYTTVNLRDVYGGALNSASREVEMDDDGGVAIRDQIEAGAAGGTVRWAMLTRAEVAADGSVATLSRDGKTLTLRVRSPEGATVRTYVSDPPPNAYDARNEGTRIVGFEVTLAPWAKERLSVFLQPEGAGSAQPRP